MVRLVAPMRTPTPDASRCVRNRYTCARSDDHAGFARSIGVSDSRLPGPIAATIRVYTAAIHTRPSEASATGQLSALSASSATG